MEKEKRRIAIALVKLNLLCLLAAAGAIESPRYTIVHAESDFEVRLYGNSTWMAAPVRDLSFEKATLNGFHRLFQFIEGANLNYSRIPMTLPVVTSIVPGAGPLHSSAYAVLFYLPAKFQATPPTPLPELHLKPFNWTSHCVAARKFPGFAKDENIVHEAEQLAFSLSRSTWANATSAKSGYAYSIAQYSAPFQLIGRVNEVWVDVDASNCTSSGIAAY
ncbi:heme-binding protein 2-like [Punica granatum]|uniref:Uncharacterized protein n=2 Tax=Punica granatum TaxID=22663 RepID=A0A2I0I2H1_PUNGR|nr:heme-binding protein 2-like [Punica granatum]PKI37920.1 hypothetical protein CRG98_041695 [Punica granatum]